MKLFISFILLLSILFFIQYREKQENKKLIKQQYNYNLFTKKMYTDNISQFTDNYISKYSDNQKNSKKKNSIKLNKLNVEANHSITYDVNLKKVKIIVNYNF